MPARPRSQPPSPLLLSRVHCWEQCAGSVLVACALPAAASDRPDSQPKEAPDVTQLLHLIDSQRPAPSPEKWACAPQRCAGVCTINRPLFSGGTATRSRRPQAPCQTWVPQGAHLPEQAGVRNPQTRENPECAPLGAMQLVSPGPSPGPHAGGHRSPCACCLAAWKQGERLSSSLA